MNQRPHEAATTHQVPVWQLMDGMVVIPDDGKFESALQAGEWQWRDYHDQKYRLKPLERVRQALYVLLEKI